MSMSMKNIKKNIRITLTVTEISWLVFIVLHLLFTGKTAIWNFPGSLPTFIFVLIPLIFLIVEILQRKRRITGILAALLSIFLGASQLDINLFPVKEVSRSGQCREITVFNWNTCYWDQFKDRDHFYEFLKKQQADIYILQEYLHNSKDWRYPSNEKQVEDADSAKLFSICSVVPGFTPHYVAIDEISRLAQVFPGYHIRSHLQFVFISRFPIKDSYPDYSEQYAVADVDIDGRLVRVFNVHMLLHIKPGNPFVPSFYRELRQRYEARSLAIKNLYQDIEETQIDYIIAGDFNATKAMGVMNGLLKEHVDAVNYSSTLIPFSFEFKGLKFWRFDYVLAPKASETLCFKSFQNLDPEGLSDHDPQRFIIKLLQEPKVDPKSEFDLKRNK